MRNLVSAVGVAALVATFIVFVGGIAQAAPQGLGLIATNGGVELKCRGDTCYAELSTFCLQSNRYSPARGTRYEIAGGGVRLLGMDDAGHDVELSASNRLTFESLRSHVAVKVSLPRGELRRSAVDRIRIVVDVDTALLPLAQAGDPNPHTPLEAEMLVGTLRKTGSDIVDRNPDRMIAARTTSYMINALPAEVRGNHGAGAEVWQSAQRMLKRAGASPKAWRMMAYAYEFCEFAAGRNTFGNIRSCLQIQHDKFVKSLNADYWDLTQPGS